jgi:hypothetical protein
MILPIILVVLVMSVAGYSADLPLRDLLSGAVWEWHYKVVESSPTFTFSFKDGKLVLDEATSYGFGENAGNFYGAYTLVDDSTVRLDYCLYSGYDYMPDENGKIDKKPPTQHATAKLVRPKNALYYELRLECDNGALLTSEKYLVRAGLSRDFDKTTIVTMGNIPGVVTDNVKIREFPSTDAKEYKFCANMESEPVSYYPKGAKVHIVARTTKKEKVKSWNNYWYYVLLDDAHTDFSDVRFAWVFGEFVRTTGK